MLCMVYAQHLFFSGPNDLGWVLSITLPCKRWKEENRHQKGLYEDKIETGTQIKVGRQDIQLRCTHIK